MPRDTTCPYGKGSAKWTRVLVNLNQEFLRERIYDSLSLSEGCLTWFSPLKRENFREYSIQTILKRENIILKNRPLKSFWPSSGPKWDAIGRSEKGTLFLVEAKSYIKEMIKPYSKSRDPCNQKLIDGSLNETRDFFNPSRNRNWPTTFYQFANRLAFIYLLKKLNKIPAYLILLNFINDPTQKESPKSSQEWEGAYQLLKSHFGIYEKRYSKYACDINIDVDEIPYRNC